MLISAGMMKTYQLSGEGPYGTAKKIAPMTTETVRNQLNCFETPGSSDEPIEAQGILPDISNFKVNVFPFVWFHVLFYFT